MELINVGERVPRPFEMVIFDTDKGIAVGCFDGFGEPNQAIFGFTVVVAHSRFEVLRWMPLPTKGRLSPSQRPPSGGFFNGLTNGG